ncbi:MAG: SOS response-associated peptidase [Planctomycetaceae bacterium]
MCGRFTLSTPAAKLIELFQVTAFPQFEPRYNIAPTQLVICIRDTGRDREASGMRWGLIPSWAKDESIGNRLINARAETAAEKPSFRSAYRKRRCLIPVDGFYEWEKREGRGKQPWLIHRPKHQPFAFAGLWESWRPKVGDNADASPVLSCTILTTAANTDVSDIHDRMPVIIPREHFNVWLDTGTDIDRLAELTQPSAPGTLQRYEVSTLVNRPTVDSSECVLPL